MILEKIESSILNGLGYIVRLEKKNGNKKFRVKFAIKACFEFFARCDVSSIRLTCKNSSTNAFLIKFSSEIQIDE